MTTVDFHFCQNRRDFENNAENEDSRVYEFGRATTYRRGSAYKPAGTYNRPISRRNVRERACIVSPETVIVTPESPSVILVSFATYVSLTQTAGTLIIGRQSTNIVHFETILTLSLSLSIACSLALALALALFLSLSPSLRLYVCTGTWRLTFRTGGWKIFKQSFRDERFDGDRYRDPRSSKSRGEVFRDATRRGFVQRPRTE